MELEHQGIISDGVRKEVRMTMSGREQNELLHLHLRKSCTKEALLKVCNVLIDIKGHPRMQQFGKELKSELEKGILHVLSVSNMR